MATRTARGSTCGLEPWGTTAASSGSNSTDTIRGSRNGAWGAGWPAHLAGCQRAAGYQPAPQTLIHSRYWVVKQPGACILIASVLAVAAGQLGPGTAAQPAAITVDYPEDGSVFPLEITAPTFIWHDASAGAALWRIEVKFSDGSAAIGAQSRGERLRIGEIDRRTVAATNELPRLSTQLASARTWTPDTQTWAAIKKHSAGRPATITITGFGDGASSTPISRGRVVIETSKDPVGAPILYRDVPLMPSELEKGVIKPLDASAVPLIAWRLRNIGEPRSRLLMEGLHTCANCHSFSRDGKTLGMDLDGPRNDKGMY